MQGITWEILANKEKTIKPYRGTTNRYPLGNRTHNTKCFYVVERDGEKVYSITYGYRAEYTYHTKEEFEEDVRKNGDKSTIGDWGSHIEDSSKRYRSHVLVPNELGVVRSDNTFEFTSDSYHQGDNIVMSRLTNGWFYRSSRHGGMVYRQCHNVEPIFHPIFKGLRVSCDTMMPHPSSQYTVIGNRVDRKSSKVFTDRYKDFYKVNEVMFKATTSDNILETGVDVMNSCDVDFSAWWLSVNGKSDLIKFADDNLITSPLESCMAYAIAFDIKDSYRRIKAYGSLQKYYRDIEPLELFDSVKRKLNKELYKTHPEVFKEVELASCTMYPASEWGIKILVNGKEVEQC